jgi:uncharacterized protein YaiI (UPF0178 family)
MVKILVDADSCPARCREIIARRALKEGLEAVFIANHIVALPQENRFVKMEICGSAPGSADDRLAELAAASDVAITRDVPLAARLLEKNAAVLDDRGRVFTRGNIDYHLSMRDANIAFSESGLTVRTKNYGARELKAFSDAFDRIIGTR